MKTPTITTIAPPGFIALTLTRPVTPRLARRLTENLTRIVALDYAGKSLDDAAGALGISKSALIQWLGILGLKWSAAKVYKKTARVAR